MEKAGHILADKGRAFTPSLSQWGEGGGEVEIKIEEV